MVREREISASPHPRVVYELTDIGWLIFEQETDRLYGTATLGRLALKKQVEAVTRTAEARRVVANLLP
jgi:hypothetical protein